MKFVEITSADIEFKMMAPCEDCPFKRSTKKHSGVAGALMEYHSNMEAGTFAHTCHKTDVRADSVHGRRHQGKPQHCGGALALMKNDPTCTSNLVINMIARRKINPKKIKTDGVYASFREMVRDYARWMKSGMKEDLSTDTKSALIEAGMKVNFDDETSGLREGILG